MDLLHCSWAFIAVTMVNQFVSMKIRKVSSGALEVSVDFYVYLHFLLYLCIVHARAHK